VSSVDPLLWLWLAASIAGCWVALLAYRQMMRTIRGRSGLPYSEIVGELYEETERRGELIAAWAAARTQRLERLERR